MSKEFDEMAAAAKQQLETIFAHQTIKLCPPN
jgi:hypothetical protein